MKKALSFNIIIGMILFFMPVVQAQEAASILTFAQFSEKVLHYYPQLKAAHTDVQAALARQMQARAGFWPSLDLSADYQESDDPVNVFGMKLRQERFASSDFEVDRLNTPRHHRDLAGGVHVELPLIDAMQTIYRTRAAREQVKATEADEDFTRMEALLTAQDAYLNALVLERLATIVDEVQKSADEDLQKAKDLKDKGMILGADYYAARVMFGDMTRMKNEIFRQKKAMMVLLNILMGEPMGTTWELVNILQEKTVLSREVESLVREAGVSRPDLKALDLRVKAADLELSREKASALPRLMAFGDATNNRRDIHDAGGSNFTVGVKARMSLFDPSRSGRVKEALALKERLAHDIQILKDTVARAIAGETARYDAFRDNLPVLRAMSEDAKEAVSLTAPLYSEGRKSVADLMDARRAYLQTIEGYEKALMGAFLSQGRLLFLTGQLNEGVLSALGQEGGL
jgi:outer membrane protein TolC